MPAPQIALYLHVLGTPLRMDLHREATLSLTNSTQDVTPLAVMYEYSTLTSTGAALLDKNEATAKSTSQDGGMAVNFG